MGLIMDLIGWNSQQYHDELQNLAGQVNKTLHDDLIRRVWACKGPQAILSAVIQCDEATEAFNKFYRDGMADVARFGMRHKKAKVFRKEMRHLASLPSINSLDVRLWTLAVLKDEK
jgi:hypothetical protein